MTPGEVMSASEIRHLLAAAAAPAARRGERRALDHDEQPARLALEDGEYRPVEHSGLIDLGAHALAEQLDWPAIQPA